MQRTSNKIRIWLTLAVATVSLALASSASAMFNTSDPGATNAAPQTPVVTPTNGFDWNAALLGASVAIVIALCLVGLAYAARNRTRLVPSH